MPGGLTAKAQVGMFSCSQDSESCLPGRRAHEVIFQSTMAWVIPSA